MRSCSGDFLTQMLRVGTPPFIPQSTVTCKFLTVENDLKFDITPLYAHKAADKSGAIVLPTSAYEQAKKVAPGMDIYYLETQWRDWIAKLPLAKNTAGWFVEFCHTKYKQKNQL